MLNSQLKAPLHLLSRCEAKAIRTLLSTNYLNDMRELALLSSQFCELLKGLEIHNKVSSEDENEPPAKRSRLVLVLNIFRLNFLPYDI